MNADYNKDNVEEGDVINKNLKCHTFSESQAKANIKDDDEDNKDNDNNKEDDTNQTIKCQTLLESPFIKIVWLTGLGF